MSVATLPRTPQGQSASFEVTIDDDCVFPFDRADLAEVLGNLLENAARHAASPLSIGTDADGRTLTIDDDGPGFDPAARAAALSRGGAGLGLAIVQDVLDAYGWRLELGTSHLGGLEATIGEAGS